MTSSSAEAEWGRGIANADIPLMRAAAQKLFTPDAEFRRPTGETEQARFIGYENFAPWIEGVAKAFHPIAGEELDAFSDGARSAKIVCIRGTHSGTFALPGLTPVGPTGRSVYFEELTYSWWENGRITAQFAYFDLLAVLRQIGAA